MTDFRAVSGETVQCWSELPASIGQCIPPVVFSIIGISSGVELLDVLLTLENADLGAPLSEFLSHCGYISIDVMFILFAHTRHTPHVASRKDRSCV